MDFLSLIFYFIIIIPSAIIHEYAHGWMAWMLGDPTAKYAGRLSLDPRVHIDKWGTILLPIFLYFISNGSFVFAYAKPVPYNPYNLKNQKWGPAMVGLAGPMANIATALIFSIFIRVAGIPTSSFIFSIISFFTLIVYANIILAIFNLVPIPPLDGSKILFAILPDSAYKAREFLERYGIFLLFFFIFFAFEIIRPVIEAVFRVMIGS